jgi:pyruvate formate lyase activating enzyme
MVNGSHVLDRALCVACGTCTAECWAQALKLAGRTADVREIISEVLRDEPFYESSGGGLTLSGGEPLWQIDFAKALLKAAGRNGIHRCVETCGAVPISAFKDVMSHVDLFLFDLKDTVNTRHIVHTGVPNTQILGNLRYLHDNGAEIRLRLPVIPDLNDSSDHFDGIAALVATLPNLCGVEIMPYHKLGLDKDRRFGLTRDVQLPRESAPSSRLRDWMDRLSAVGVNVKNDPSRISNGMTREST